MKNYYEILEVNQKASSEIIEKAYRVLIKKYHPDTVIKEKEEFAEKKIREINEAYKVLSDEFLREQYNAELKRNIERENESKYKKIYNIAQQKNGEEKYSKKSEEVGELKSIVKLTKHIFENLPKLNKTKKVKREDIVAIGLTIVIVLILGIILWFIPITNGFIRNLIPW